MRVCCSLTTMFLVSNFERIHQTFSCNAVVNQMNVQNGPHVIGSKTATVEGHIYPSTVVHVLN